MPLLIYYFLIILQNEIFFKGFSKKYYNFTYLVHKGYKMSAKIIEAKDKIITICEKIDNLLFEFGNKIL